jgi:hypothetical protein
MTDCKIIYTGDKRTGVYGLDDKPSETFQEILNNGQVKDFDEALEIYKGLYSDNIRYSIIGEKGATNLDELEQVSNRISNLNTAKLMEKEGKTPIEIRRTTGWERGAGKIDLFDKLSEEEALMELENRGEIIKTEC